MPRRRGNSSDVCFFTVEKFLLPMKTLCSVNFLKIERSTIKNHLTYFISNNKVCYFMVYSFIDIFNWYIYSTTDWYLFICHFFPANRKQRLLCLKINLKIPNIFVIPSKSVLLLGNLEIPKEYQNYMTK